MKCWSMKIRCIALFLLLPSVSISRTEAGPVDGPIGCTVFPYIQRPLCSGKGSCVMESSSNNVTLVKEPNLPNTRCLCDSGWTGVNDFVNMDSHDCGQSIIFIFAVWSIILITSFFGLIVSLVKLYQSYHAAQEEIRTSTEYNADDGNSGSNRGMTCLNKWLLLLRWPVGSSSLLSFFSLLCLGIAALIRLANPLSAIGVSPAMTLFFTLGDIGFNCAEPGLMFAWLNVQRQLLQFTEKDEATTKGAILRLMYVVRICLPFALSRVFFIFLILPLPQFSNAFAVVYFMANGITVLIQGVGCVRAGRALEAILVNGLEELPSVAKQERDIALKSIRSIIKNQKNASVLPILTALTIAWWPFLRSHLTYFLLPLCMAGPHLALHLTALSPPRTATRKEESKTQVITSKATTERKGEEIEEIALMSGESSPRPSPDHPDTLTQNFKSPDSLALSSSASSRFQGTEDTNNPERQIFNPFREEQV